MHELQELRRKRDSYLQTAQNIVSKAIAESRALTTIEQADVQGLREKAAAATETIQQAEELRGLTAGTSTTRGTGAQGSETLAGGAGPFTDLGTQLRCIVDAGREGRQVDQRLFEVRAASGLSEAVGSDGGFLLQPSFSTELLTAGRNQAMIAPLCRRFPLGANSNGIELPIVDETSRAAGSRFGGLQLNWSGEAGELTGSKPKFAKLSIKLGKLTGLVFVTDELLADSTALASFVSAAYSAEFAFTVDDAILRGTGAGKPLGIFNSNALVTVPKETGQLAATVQYENIVKMYARMPATSLRTAVWLVNQDVMPQLMTMTIGAGSVQQPVYLPPTGAAGAPFGTLLGRPVVPIEQAATVGSVGDVTFADFSQYLLADKGGLQQASSIHVKFLTDEQCSDSPIAWMDSRSSRLR